MPQLIIKGVSAQQTQQLAPKMIEVVSRLVECPEDWVTVELCESKFFDKNGPTEQYPIIQIWWYSVRCRCRTRSRGSCPSCS